MKHLVRQLFIIFAFASFWGCSQFARQATEDRPPQESPGESTDSTGGSTHVMDLLGDESSPQMTAPESAAPAIPTNISPENLYKLMLAEIAAQRGQIDVAVYNYLDVAAETKDPQVAQRATQMANYLQDISKALSAAGLWVEVDADNPEAHRAYASVLLKIGRVSDAIGQYEKMLELMPEQPTKGYSIIVAQLSREPDRSVALSVMEKIVEKRQNDPQALFAYSHLAMRHAKFDVALETLDKVLAIDPKWSKAIILRARIVAMQGGRDEAIKYLDGVLQGELADNTEVRMTYARMLTEARKFDPALEQFIKLSKLEPRNSEIHYFAGVLALQLKKLDEAEEHLNTLLKIGRRVMEGHYYLGQVAELRENTEEAIQHYSSVKRGELYFNAQVRVVALLADEKQYELARNHVHTIRADSDKQQVQLYLLEGDVLREAGKPVEAKDFYSQILVQEPNETSIRYARALLAEKLGDLDMVEKDLLYILDLEPENAQVLNALGYTLADRTNRYEEALRYIEKALELEPNDAAVMDSMGWVQYHLGNYQSALSHLRKANEITKDPEIAAHLGEVLWVTGKKDDALKIWEDSLKEHPDHEVLLKVMKRFGL